MGLVALCICLANLFCFQNCAPSAGLGTSDTNSVQGDGELFPHGKLNNEDDLAHFNQKFYGSGGALPPQVLSSEAGHDGGKGLRLDNEVFQALPEAKLNTDKAYLVSFWARKLSGSKSTPELNVHTGFGKDPYLPEGKFKPVASMKIESSTWVKVMAVIKPTGPNLYFEFYIMLGDGNVVDIDQISVREI
jgi:hypothetical protein